jgi:hypothetical protein
MAGRQRPIRHALAFRTWHLGSDRTLPSSNKKGPKRRFWNCFGLQNPADYKRLRIVVEINPPHEGENRRVAGRFVRDDEGRIYLGHTGKVGGGSAGVGKDAFRKFFKHHQWHEIETGSGKESILVLGPIDGPAFTKQVAGFVRKVADFKKEAKRAHG